MDDEVHEQAYVEGWKKHLFVGSILPLLSPYSRMISKQPAVALPLDVAKLEEQGINIPDDLKRATTYREFFRLVEDYASVGLAELRSLNPITRGKAAVDIESDD